MAVLKFEIDTDEIYQNEYDDNTFEDVVRQAIGTEVKVKMQSNFSGEAFERVSKNIALECVHQVERKLHNLINEDVVMQDRWGDNKFIGSVEDYIKQQIDNKLLRAVNSSGKTLEGCSVGSDNDTWIEWKIENEIGKHLSRIEKDAEKSALNFCKNKLDATLKKFQETTLSEVILERLNSIGVG